jgi:hypothetical protein
VLLLCRKEKENLFTAQGNARKVSKKVLFDNPMFNIACCQREVDTHFDKLAVVAFGG